LNALLLKFTHVFKSWEAHSTIPTNNFHFKLTFTLPDPRKARLILERDALGRIIHSKPPAMPLI
jgi:hypothetical protein